MTSESMIDYEALAQDAMRSVVRAVLTRTASSGLPGDHHFYISFDTQASGASISKRLKEKYASEMTIVLQHRFWDLQVYEDHFEVKLTFDGVPERLVVPFDAIKVFFDPSVRYGLQFEEPEFNVDAVEQSMATLEAAAGFDEPDLSRETKKQMRRSSPAKKSKNPRKTAKVSDKTPDKPLNETPSESAASIEQSDAVGAAEVAENMPECGAQIVRLDAFRKNNRNSS